MSSSVAGIADPWSTATLGQPHLPADIVFRDGVAIDLGSVTVHVHHVGGDHSAESSVM